MAMAADNGHDNLDHERKPMQICPNAARSRHHHASAQIRRARPDSEIDIYAVRDWHKGASERSYGLAEPGPIWQQ